MENPATDSLVLNPASRGTVWPKQAVMNRKEFWNERYRGKEYVYGTEPNEYLSKVLTGLPGRGHILLPAEGEGRNAVFAARQGWKVTAFDLSAEGRKKALRLARQHGVQITYQVGEFSELSFPENTFDAIGLFYAHFAAPLRSAYHRQLAAYLKTSGVVIFEAFSKHHAEFQKIYPEAGGPREEDRLFSTEEIKNDFPDFQIIELKEEIVELNAGSYHKGKGSVIRFFGRKTA